MATTNLGKVVITTKGAWSSTTAYEILDVVVNNGTSYVAKKAVPAGTALNNTEYWQLFAEKGETGTFSTATASVDGNTGTPSVVVTKGGTGEQSTIDFAFHNIKGDAGNPTGSNVLQALGTSTTDTISQNAASTLLVNNDVIANEYSASATYKVCDYCMYNTDMYRCTTAITTAEAWTAAHWTKVQVGGQLSELKQNLVDNVNTTSYRMQYVLNSTDGLLHIVGTEN